MKVVYSIKVKVKNYQLDLKGFFNLSQTMKFIVDFHHRLSIGKIWYKFHGPRQIKKLFKLSKRKKKSTGNPRQICLRP